MKYPKAHIKKLRTRTSNLSSQKKLTLFIVIFGVIGAAALLITNAATPTAQFEAESATLSGNSSVVSDNSASGGQALVFNSTSTPAPSYYVSTTGLDTNNGSISAPFKTITKALATVSPGQAILVKAGTYTLDFTISKSGVAGSPIYVLGEAGAKFVTTKQQADASIWIKASYVVLKGFDITGNVHITGQSNVVDSNYIHDSHHQAGVQLAASERNATDCTFNTVQNNTMYKTVGTGIYIEGQNQTVLNNEISWVMDHSPDMSNTTDADGMRFFGSNHLIKGNYIHDIWQTDQVTAPHIDMMQTFQEAHDIVFDGNVMHNPNPTGSNRILMLERQAGEGPVSNITWVNNIFIFSDDTSAALNLNRKDGQPEIVNMTVVNNVFYSPNGLIEKAASFENITNAIFRNNLVVNTGKNGSPYIDLNSTTSSSGIGYNAIYSTTGTMPKDVRYTGDIWGVNPNVIDISGTNIDELNFRLLAGSPLINTGLAHGFTTIDFDGITRPQGSGWDIGAFEFK